MTIIRRTYTIDLGGRNLHNTIKFQSVFEPLSVVRVSTVDDSGETQTIIGNKIMIQSPVSFRYDNIIQQYVDIELEGRDAMLADSLSQMDIQIGKTTYKKDGKFTQSTYRIDFNSIIVPQYEIDNVSDQVIQGVLGLEAFDKYGNTVYKYFLPISMSDDGYVYERVENSGPHTLYYDPLGDVQLVIHTDVVSLKQSSRTVDVSIPNGYIGYIKYKPQHMQSQLFQKITDEVQISGDWQINLSDYNCSHLEYRYIVDVFNPELTSINSTPIIKRLALIQAEI